MPRVPMIYQQTLPQGGRADASMMGGASAQAMAQAGDVLAQIGERMQRREDAIASTHAAREQDRWLTESRRATETEDLVKKRTFDDWKSAAEAHKQQLLNNYTGSPRGRGALDQQLTNQLYQHEKALREQQHKAQIGMLTEFIEDEKNKLAIEVGFAPEMLGIAFDSFDDRVDQYEGVLPTELLESYKKSARGALVQTAVSQLEAQGRFDEARAVLNNPDFGKFLPPDVSRRLTIGVAAGQGKQAEAQRQADNRVLRMRSIMPNMTADQEAILRAQPSKSERTPFDDIIDYKLINPNEEVPRALIDRVFNLASTGGDSTIERNMRIIKDNADRIASGLATEDEYRSFVNAVTILGRPRQARDIYGHQVTIPGGVPSYALEALKSWDVNRGGTQSIPSQRAPVPTLGDVFEPMADDDIGEPFMTEGPDGQMRKDFPAFEPQPGDLNYEEAMQAGMAGQAPAQPAPRRVYASATPGMMTADQSIMDLAPLIVGFGQRAASITSRIPGAGGIPQGHFQEAKTRYKMVQEAATMALRPQNKIAEQYRQELRDIVDLRNRTFDTPERLWQHITGLDNSFRRALQQLEPLAQGRIREASPEQIQEAADQYRAIKTIIDEFDVPQVRIQTNAEHDALPPGTRFFYGDKYQPLTKR